MPEGHSLPLDMRRKSPPFIRPMAPPPFHIGFLDNRGYVEPVAFGVSLARFFLKVHISRSNILTWCGRPNVCDCVHLLQPLISANRSASALSSLAASFFSSSVKLLGSRDATRSIRSSGVRHMVNSAPCMRRSPSAPWQNDWVCQRTRQSGLPFPWLSGLGVFQRAS